MKRDALSGTKKKKIIEDSSTNQYKKIGIIMKREYFLFPLELLLN